MDNRRSGIGRRPSRRGVNRFSLRERSAPPRTAPPGTSLIDSIFPGGVPRMIFPGRSGRMPGRVVPFRGPRSPFRNPAAFRTIPSRGVQGNSHQSNAGRVDAGDAPSIADGSPTSLNDLVGHTFRATHNIPITTQYRDQEIRLTPDMTLMKDMDGRPIPDAAIVVGRETIGKDKNLSFDDLNELTRGLYGARLRFLPNSKFEEGVVGRFRERPYKNKPAGIEILDELSPEQRHRVGLHEIGHGLDALRTDKSLSPRDVNEQLQFIYHEGATGAPTKDANLFILGITVPVTIVPGTLR